MNGNSWGIEVTNSDKHAHDSFALKLPILVIFILMITYTDTTHAQPSEQQEPRTEIPLTLGLGGATHRFGVSINIAYPVSFQTFAFEFLYLAEVKVPLGEAEQPPASKDIEYSLLYGLRMEGSSGVASISSGLSIVKSIHVFSNGPSSFSLPLIYTVERGVSVAIPLRIQLILKTSEHFGFGFTYFSSFNSHYNYDGIVLSLRRVIN